MNNRLKAAAAKAATSRDQEWSCQRCTFLNPASASRCDACEAPRPGGSGIGAGSFDTTSPVENFTRDDPGRSVGPPVDTFQSHVSSRGSSGNANADLGKTLSPSMQSARAGNLPMAQTMAQTVIQSNPHLQSAKSMPVSPGLGVPTATNSGIQSGGQGYVPTQPPTGSGGNYGSGGYGSANTFVPSPPSRDNSMLPVPQKNNDYGGGPYPSTMPPAGGGSHPSQMQASPMSSQNRFQSGGAPYSASAPVGGYPPTASPRPMGGMIGMGGSPPNFTSGVVPGSFHSGGQSRTSSRQTANPSMHPGRANDPLDFRSDRPSGLVGCKMQLLIFGATNLRNTDLGSLPGDVSDPFLTARLGKYVERPSGKVEFVPGPQEFQTEVIDNNLNPVWKRKYHEFDIRAEDEDVLRMEIFSASSFVHDSLGRFEIRLERDNAGEIKNPYVIRAGETRRFHERLEDGNHGRMDEKNYGMLEVEVRLLTPQQIQRGETGGRHVLAIEDLHGVGQSLGHSLAERVDVHQFGQFHADQAAAKAVRKMQDHKVLNKVPLPNFKDQGPQAYERPPPELGAYKFSWASKEKSESGAQRAKSEYTSLACHLGQYDYNSDKGPIYYPKQEEIDKGMWQNDAFYGWRNQNDNDALLQGRILTDRNQGAQNVEVWSRDPFHEWLDRDKSGRPKEVEFKERQAREQWNQQEQYQMHRLPSFSEIPKKRFEDHREYVNLHEVGGNSQGRPRQRQSDPGEFNESHWRDDAFYGWLPKRGPPSKDKHLFHRPLEEARLDRCPSFSKELPTGGLRGVGIGVLRVWLNSAKDLSYSDNTPAKPTACLKIRVGSAQSAQERITDSVEPTAIHDGRQTRHVWKWYGVAFAFEVNSEDDHLSLECLELPHFSKNAKSNYQHFLGRYDLPIRSAIQQYEQLADRSESNRPIPVRDMHLQNTKSGLIDFAFQFEPYDSDGARRVEKMRASARAKAMRLHPDRPTQAPIAPKQGLSQGIGPGGLPRSPSTVSDRTSLGMLSVRIIAGYNLVNMDSGILGDVSDPFVTIKLKSQNIKERKRTQTINNDLNPRWNSSPFLLKVSDENDILELEVFDDDENLISSSADFLGRMHIPVFQLIRNPDKPLRLRDNLADIKHGELEVEVGFKPG